MDNVHIGLWIFFGVAILTSLAVDLGLKSHRHRTRAVTFGEAGRWTIFWVSLAMVFAGAIYWTMGHQRALEFITAYLIEESLSVDNMFVFVMIFQFFGIPAIQQPRVLKWGILGAVIMRFILIFTGVALIAKFHWILYVFGALLIITAIKMVTGNEEKMDPSQNPVLKFFKRFVPFTTKMHEEHFFIKEGVKWVATPLFAALLVVEASDLVFAIDSIPAVLAVSKDPFIVFTSNVFAIMGLRSLYFLVSGFMGLFHYLRYGLAIVLVFIGVKMLIAELYKIPILVSLSVVISVLTLSILASVIWKKKAS